MIVEGTPPERFRLEHGHYVEDLAFWRALAGEVGSPVLDLGAAVGRVAIPLARDGHEVWAVDGSPGMLGELGRAIRTEPEDVGARIHPVRADLRALALGRTFPLVLIPMNTLQAFVDADDRRACLAAAAGHVDPVGELAFDLAMADLDAIAGALGVEQPGVTWADPESGATLRHSAWFDAADVDTGTVSFTTRIEETAPDGAVTTHCRPQTVHLFSPTEVWELVAEAGLEVRAVYGDFDGRPLDARDERQIYRCGVAS